MHPALKIFSFNLRTVAPADGINMFFNRTGRILEAIKTNDPDLIGFQEVTDAMRAWLDEALSPLGYAIVGCGREQDYRGESTCIAFKRADFSLIALETRWLSATPTVPGSRYAADQSHCPRIFTAATLKHREADTPFILLNTHLDHQGSEARKLGALDVIRYLSERHLGFIITGDMNALPDAPEICVFTSYALNGRPVIDATAKIGGTFHDYGRLSPTEAKKIDYIFTDLPCDPAASFMVADEPVDGLYISDHNPICALITLP